MPIMVGIVKINQIIKSGYRLHLIALKITIIKINASIVASISGEIYDQHPSILIPGNFSYFMIEFFVKCDYDPSRLTCTMRKEQITAPIGDPFFLIVLSTMSFLDEKNPFLINFVLEVVKNALTLMFLP